MRGAFTIGTKTGFWRGLALGLVLGLLPSAGIGYVLYQSMNTNEKYLIKINDHLIWMTRNKPEPRTTKNVNPKR